MSFCFFYLDVPFWLWETVHNWSIHWSIDASFRSDLCLRVLPIEALTSSCHLETVFWHFLCVALVEKSYIDLTLWTLVYLSPQLGASYQLQALKMCTWGLSSWKGDIARQVWIFRLMAACVLSQMATDLWQDWFMHCVCEVRIGQPSGASEVSSSTPVQFSYTACSIYVVHYQTSRISSAAVYLNTSQ